MHIIITSREDSFGHSGFDCKDTDKDRLRKLLEVYLDN